MLTREPLPPTKQKLEFCNEGTQPIEVMVEMIPNRYVLLPKDKLVVIADVENAPRNEGYTLNVSGNFVQIYAAWDAEPEACINGEPAKTDWATQVD